LGGGHAARYIRSVRQLMRQRWRWFLSFALAGGLLRWFFAHAFPKVTVDSQVYADIANNWLRHGVYGLTEFGQIVPTYTRMPGYPAFLAVMFAAFGLDNFRVVIAAQILLDLATCVVVADLARRVTGSTRAAQAAFALAALCPFLANYSATVLTETLSVFAAAVALDFAVAGLARWEVGSTGWQAVAPWAGCGAFTAAAILLRPDGGLLLIGMGLYLTVRIVRERSWRKISALLVLGFVSLAPLAPWAVRNLHTMHRFRPLAPRYANDPEDFVPAGFNRWVATWIADYVSTEEIYWQVPGAPLDLTKLPARAFDSTAQRDTTAALIDAYNQDHDLTPALDAEFAALAEQRVRAAPRRYYVTLPALRIASMWLRPRTEMLSSDARWWEFNDDELGSAWAVALGVLGFVYVGLAAAGARRVRFLGMLLMFVIARSLFLGTLENPEPRYTLECYPVILVMAAAWWSGSGREARQLHR
jgi:4-amino-4-deoxy-L-arabinose transferase-like glycosyltransferase